MAKVCRPRHTMYASSSGTPAARMRLNTEPGPANSPWLAPATYCDRQPAHIRSMRRR